MLKEVYGQTIKILRILLHHSVWKSQKKSYFTTFKFLSWQKFLIWQDLEKVLPDRSLLIEQKLVKNAKIQNLKCDILSNFHKRYSFFFKFFDQF